MTEKTLGEYIERLRPVQQDYIVYCVQEFGGRKDFHRGLLPFLPALEAVCALLYKLEEVKGPPTVGTAINPVVGEKFIRGILSVFFDAIGTKMYADEDSVEMYLKTAKLQDEYGRRLSKRFCVTLGISPDSMALLQNVGHNLWKVTTRKRWLEATTLWLAETYR